MARRSIVEQTPRKILLLSAYDAASHKRWRQGLMQFLPEFDWTCLSLSPRFFSWRIRGNSLIWAQSEADTLSAGFDLVLATSMVDLAALRGMVPAIANTPAIVYFHENQFGYPESEHGANRPEGRIVNLYSAVAAERLLFNSRLNRDSFIDGAVDWMNQMPDHKITGLRSQFEHKSQILPVPLEPDLFCDHRETPGTDRVSLIWAHRWEWDKGPALLLETVKRLLELEVKFKLNLVGQQFRQQPEAFAKIRQTLEHRDPEALGAWGFEANIDNYRKLLQESDLVLSTADHDFQGLAVMEAVAAGCLPILPDRLAYPEFFDAQWLFKSAESRQETAANMAEKIEYFAHMIMLGQRPVAPSLRSLSWETLGQYYRESFAAAMR